ncbi:MAG TPA: TIGR03620 family F420-dependent LLM class oxidoreductase [Microbacteriaceae bacterium]|nr:TIGR03620 family F420-dependent LLM class oxidoreductase [Microbacteriaceae bacterium]HQX34957.1 TIGR03620 family F420-dependent LLM class oxidoreductase [Microbacteriaceae bacterium]HQZ47100.1 TIGR03620 family F420-dependent LLM class oxidoreductase [Microbacteriaceae bacterium]HRA08000.1 TIGR03620 family F420-dependent LLM class oxidoreductase [Microbacteriaceae bacterium]
MTNTSPSVPAPQDASLPGLGSVGVWRSGTSTSLEPALAGVVERLGYGTLWIGGSPRADLAIAEALLDASDTLVVSTGIVNIWTAPAEEVAASFHRIERTHPGRFVLGIGIGHREAIGDRFEKPYAALVSYLDALDAHGVPVHRRVIAALGARTLRLSAERSAGTHPYLTTPAHTAFAREVVGPDALVAPEQRLVLGTDVEASRATARAFLSRYMGLSNYRRTLEAHGFAASDLDNGVTDAAVDALVPHGAPAVLAAAVEAHLAAGANHVCVQSLPGADDPVPLFTALAGELGL